MSDADTGLPKPNIWYILVDGNEATSCSTEAEKKEDEKKRPSIREEKKEDEVVIIEDEDEEHQNATYDPYMPERKKRKKRKRKDVWKIKRKRKEGGTEHCEDVLLECGSVGALRRSTTGMWLCPLEHRGSLWSRTLHTVPLLGRRGSAVPARARATKSS